MAEDRSRKAAQPKNQPQSKLPKAPQDQTLLVSQDDVQDNVPGKIQPVFQFILDNLRTIGIGVAAFIVLVGAWSGISAWNERNVVQARQELGRILVTSDQNQRIQALESFVRKAPTEVGQSARLELARALMEARQFGRAAEVWSDVARSGDGDLKIVAAFGRATSLTAEGKADDALAELDRLKGSVPESYQQILNQQKALSAESAGKWQQAIDAYTALKSSDASRNKAFYEYKIQELQARLNGKAKAKG